MKLFKSKLKKGDYVQVKVYGKIQKIYLPQMLDSINRDRKKRKKNPYASMGPKATVKLFEKLYRARKDLNNTKRKGLIKFRKKTAAAKKVAKKQSKVIKIEAQEAQKISERQKNLILQEETLVKLKNARIKAAADKEIATLDKKKTADNIKSTYIDNLRSAINKRSSASPMDIKTVQAEIDNIIRYITDMKDARYPVPNKEQVLEQMIEHSEPTFSKVFNYYLKKASKPNGSVNAKIRYGLTLADLQSIPRINSPSNFSQAWFRKAKEAAEPEAPEAPEVKEVKEAEPEPSPRKTRSQRRDERERKKKQFKNLMLDYLDEDDADKEAEIMALANEDSQEGGRRIAASFNMKIDQPLTTTDIDKIMSPYPTYIGTLARDHLLPTFKDKFEVQGRGSCIMNLDTSDKPGSHWVALFWDAEADRPSIEYYDSLADPSEPTEDLQEMAKLLEPDQRLKLKVNKSQDQRNDTNTCGWFAIKFLIERYRGKSFKVASNYKEKHIDKTKRELFKFL